MRFLVDRCAGRQLADWLAANGHDVVHAPSLGPDPGDHALLLIAGEQDRVLVTIDTDFGVIVFAEGHSHRGIIRLPDVPASQRIALMRRILADYTEALEFGAIVTVRGERIRISTSGLRG